MGANPFSRITTRYLRTKFTLFAAIAIFSVFSGCRDISYQTNNESSFRYPSTSASASPSFASTPSPTPSSSPAPPPANTNAFRRVVGFETGDLSQLSANDFNPDRVAIVPSTLPGGGHHALRCVVPAGLSQQYCGFNLYFDEMGARNDVYVRYYVKFEPSWKFATDNIYFKALVFEVEAINYNIGGRTFLNFNASNENSARMMLLVYTEDRWIDTGVTIANDDQWHGIEVRTFRDLVSPQNGRLQFWHNGVLILDSGPHNTGNAQVDYITLGYRNGTAQNDMYMQYDEVVVSDEYVGPVR